MSNDYTFQVLLVVYFTNTEKLVKMKKKKQQQKTESWRNKKPTIAEP